MWGILDKVKNALVYDADRDFYARVFPDSVTINDLIRLRKMTVEDLPGVIAVEKKNYNYPWSKGVFKDCLKAGYSCWVYETPGQVLGFAVVSYAVDEAHLLNICIDPAIKGQGYGRRMLDHIINHLRGRASSVFLEVRPSNTVAIKLYESYGFNKIGIRKGYYQAENGREDAIMLAYEIY